MNIKTVFAAGVPLRGSGSVLHAPVFDHASSVFISLMDSSITKAHLFTYFDEYKDGRKQELAFQKTRIQEVKSYLSKWRQLGYRSKKHFLESTDAAMDTTAMDMLWQGHGVTSYSQLLSTGGRQ